MLSDLLKFLPLLLKTAGFRCGGKLRCISRSKRWSRSAQTIFASWAVVGQLGVLGLLVAELTEPYRAKADITTIPGTGDPFGTATSAGSGSFAIGISATTGGFEAGGYEYATAIGYQANAAENFARAAGYQATAAGKFSQASGYKANASGVGSRASGFEANASGDYSQALGYQAIASGYNSAALGRGATAAGSESLSIGYVSDANGENSSAIGVLASAYVNQATALGSLA